jgi:3-deoxy-D-manno-octulosonic-acid transferase
MILIIYRFLINFVFLISPIIILFRLLKKKEDLKRFKEKFCFFSKKRGLGNLIWFHGASVGEIKSVIPLIEKLEKKNTINKILITSNTLSSSKVIQNYKFKKVIHQFFPIDTNFHSKKFIDYWKPSFVFFIDSEIWPNMFLNLNKKNISINLLNGRITKKTFSKWSLFSQLSKNLFNKFDLCLSSSSESQKYLKKLGVKNVKFFGNLKFSESENESSEINHNLKKFFKSKRVWCASSTHHTEEIFCGKAHKELKKKFKSLLTVIIPRHAERANAIKSELDNLNLKVHKHNSSEKIKDNTDIYLVDTYGKTKSFYRACQNVFLGGSLINHGGQNPLEAARFGCNILHGPHVHNFKEIYSFLKKNNLTKKISHQKKMINEITKLFSKKNNSKKIQKKINFIGQNILNKTLNEINLLLKNAN